MRYRLAVLMLLMLFSALPMLNVLAAPAPAPWVILDLGPPPKDETLDKHLDHEIDLLTSPEDYLFFVWIDPEIPKLPSVAALKNGRPWLARNLRVRKLKGSRIELTFRGGERREQVAVLNTLLRLYMKAKKDHLKNFLEKNLRWCENNVVELEERIKSGQHPRMVNQYREGIKELRTIEIPARRAEVERYKKIAVIKWAR